MKTNDMEQKTVSHLNKKVWYRFLKVFYILTFLFALLVFNMFVSSDGIKKIDQNNTIIKCNVFDKKTFSLSEISLSLISSDFKGNEFNYKDFFEGYHDYEIMTILKACAGQGIKNLELLSGNGDVFNNQKSAEIVNKYGLIGVKNKSEAQLNILNADWNLYKKQVTDVFGSEKNKYLDFNFQMFDIVPVFTYTSFLGLVCIGNVLILLALEAVKRIFYYIVLGKINPDK